MLKLSFIAHGYSLPTRHRRDSSSRERGARPRRLLGPNSLSSHEVSSGARPSQNNLLDPPSRCTELRRVGNK